MILLVPTDYFADSYMLYGNMDFEYVHDSTDLIQFE